MTASGWVALALLLLLVGLRLWLRYAFAVIQRPEREWPWTVRAADRLGGWIARRLHIDNPKHW